MIALKTIRTELAELLADELDVAVAPLGANVNPPCVVVQAADPYLEMVTYCVDGINLEAIIIPRSGEGSAVNDALDDLIDQVRTALTVKSPGGIKFAYQGIDSPGMLPIGERSHWGAAVRVRYERDV